MSNSEEVATSFELLLDWISKDPASCLDPISGGSNSKDSGVSGALLHDAVPRVLQFIERCQPFRLKKKTHIQRSASVETSSSIALHEKNLKRWIANLLLLSKSKETSERITCTYLIPPTVEQIEDPQILPLFLETFSILLHKSEEFDIRIKSFEAFTHWLNKFESSKTVSSISLGKKGLDGSSSSHQLSFTKCINSIVDISKSADTYIKAEPVLSVLKDALRASPPSCRPIVGSVESIAVSWLSNEVTMEDASFCLAAIPSCFGGSAASEWENLIIKLISAGNDLLTQLGCRETKFSRVNCIEGSSSNSFQFENLTKFGFDDTGNKPKSKKSSAESLKGYLNMRKDFDLTAKFSGIALALCHAMSVPQNRISARLPLKLLLDIISRVMFKLPMNCNEYTSSVLMERAIQILETIVPPARLHMLRYTSSVADTLNHALSISSCLTAFQVCHTCIVTLGSSFAMRISKGLVQRGSEFIQKLLSASPASMLQSRSNHGNKRRRMNESSSDLKEGVSSQCIRTCIAILECFGALFEVSGSLLDVKSRSLLDQLFLEALTPVVNGSTFLLETSALISRDSSLRLAFYKVLLSSVLSPVGGSHISTALPLAIKAFSQGQKDTNIEVVAFCLHASATTQLILHPSAPSLIPFAISQKKIIGGKIPSGWNTLRQSGINEQNGEAMPKRSSSVSPADDNETSVQIDINMVKTSPVTVTSNLEKGRSRLENDRANVVSNTVSADNEDTALGAVDSQNESLNETRAKVTMTEKVVQEAEVENVKVNSTETETVMPVDAPAQEKADEQSVPVISVDVPEKEKVSEQNAPVSYSANGGESDDSDSDIPDIV